MQFALASKKVVSRSVRIEPLEPRTLLSGGGRTPPVPTPVARWAFDDGSGTTAVDSSGNGHDATLGTGTSWITGNVGAKAMRMNGTASALATVSGPVVDTATSFTVSAWVNLSNLNGYQTFVSISGASVSGFYLGLRGDTGTLSFARLNSDATGGAVVAAADSAPTTNTWYHIVGVNDAAAGTIALFVDGQLVSTATYTAGWHANGNTLIGHGFYGGNQVDYVNGAVDEVSMYASALSAEQIAALDHPGDYTLDEGAGATSVDVSGHGNTLNLNTGAGWVAGHTGSGALSFAGTSDGNASAATPVVDTTQPFSVSAWVKLSSLSGFQTFASIDGTNTSGFYLQLRGDTGRFAFTRLRTDSNSATVYHADATATPTIGTWYNLLGVNDVASGQVRLYVNGVLQSSASAPFSWKATGATVIGGGKFNGGRVDFVNGQIDDVRFYNSPLSAEAAAVVPYIGADVQSFINVAAATTGITVSSDLSGLFMEDINYGGEGGVYNDLVRNSGFNDSTNALNAWSAVTGSGVSASLASDATTGPTTALTRSGRLTVTSGVSASARAGIANSGFFGVGVAPSTSYDVQFYAKASAGFTAPLTVSLESTSGTVYASAQVASITSSWAKYTVTLTTSAGAPLSSSNRFVISTNSPSANGRQIWIGAAHVFPPSYRNSPAHLRVDLMEKLAAMKPAIFRVPGGNYLEGNTYADRFQWSKTIGPIENRPGHFNSAWGYWSSDGMGLDEYLQMAELVGARPILAVFAGYTLNGTSSTGAQLTADVNDAVNELHYVLDPVTTSWGAMRAANGHAASYDVREVEVGNEDWFSSTYSARYPLFYDAIHSAFPQLKIIASHTDTGGRPFDMLDEHYYRSPSSNQSGQNFFDSHTRAYPVFVGEWASMEGAPTNDMNAALGDATWLLGMMENSDVVTMQSYAPLWANVNGIQWTPDLIGFDNTSSYGSPSYWAQVMLANHHGNTVVSSSLAGLSSGLRTSVTKSGSKYYMSVINLGAVDRPVTVSLSGLGAVLPTGTVTTLSASSRSATNSISNPNNIVPMTSVISGLGTSFTRTFAANSLTIIEFTSSVNWDGGGDGVHWSDAQNWTGDVAPTANDAVYIPSGANVQLGATQSLANLICDGKLSLTAGADKLLVLQGLSLGAAGVLDLADNDMILDYDSTSQLAAVRDLIFAARNGGTWDGVRGITSAAAKTNANHVTTLGVLEASDYKAMQNNAASFDGYPIDSSAVLVKYTYYGDANFSGNVNFDDYVRIDTGFNQHLTGWGNGDFNLDGVVNFDDYVLIDIAFNAQGAVLSHAPLTPRAPRLPGRAAR